LWEVVGLERGPLSLVSTTEELLQRKSSGSGLETREYSRRDTHTKQNFIPEIVRCSGTDRYICEHNIKRDCYSIGGCELISIQNKIQRRLFVKMLTNNTVSRK
jgi:hypothetical protein